MDKYPKDGRVRGCERLWSSKIHRRTPTTLNRLSSVSYWSLYFFVLLLEFSEKLLYGLLKQYYGLVTFVYDNKILLLHVDTH